MSETPSLLMEQMSEDMPQLIVEGIAIRQDDLTELLKSIHELHFMVRDLNQTIHIQSENITRLEQINDQVQQHSQATELGLNEIKSEMSSSRTWGYFNCIRTSVIPAAAAIGLHGPIMYIAGTKTGLISIPIMYTALSWMLS